MSLTRDAFFASAEFPTENVEVPGKGTVKVRAMSAGQCDRWQAAHSVDPSKDFRARLVVASAVADDGSPLFTDADVEALSALPTDVLEPIVDAAMRINGMFRKSGEDARKN